MYPASLPLFSSTSLHIAQEHGSLRTAVNRPSSAEEQQLTPQPIFVLFQHWISTLPALIWGHTTYILACAVSLVPAFLSCSVLVSVLTGLCSNFCSVLYKVPCQAIVADKADVAESFRLFQGMKGHDLLATLC